MHVGRVLRALRGRAGDEHGNQDTPKPSHRSPHHPEPGKRVTPVAPIGPEMPLARRMFELEETQYASMSGWGG